MSEIGLNINVDSYNNEGIKTIKGNNNAEIYKLYILKNKRRLSLVGKTVKLGYVMVGTTNGDVIENLNITNAEQGEITFPITNRISKKDGVYSCQLAIYGADGFLEHTATFGLTVEANIFTKIAGEIADSKDFTYLENILDKASKLSEKLKENTSSATNANSNLESNITEANNINSKLLENTSTATSLNKNLESNIDLAKEVKETIKDLDTKNIEATSKIERLEGLNAKAEELSNNINEALPVKDALVKNTEEAKAANTNLLATNQEATTKNTELQASLEKTKEFINGLDGSQNIPQIRMDVTELQNGLKSNQALNYEGSSISANDTLEGRTEGMRIGGRTLNNLIVDGHTKKEIGVSTTSKAQYSYIFRLKENTKYTVIWEIEDKNDDMPYFIEISNFENKGQIKSTSKNKGIGIINTTTGSLSKLTCYYISSQVGGGRIKNVMVLEGDWTNKEIPSFFEGLKSFGEVEKVEDKYKISILSNGKNLVDLKNVLDNEKINYTISEGGYFFTTDVKLFNNGVFKPKNANQFALSCKIKLGTCTNTRFDIVYEDGTIKSSNFATSNLGFSDISVISDISKKVSYIRMNWSSVGTIYLKDLQIEEGTQATIYEPYKQDKKDILIKEPLRSLDENIYDVIQESNGQVIVNRAIGQYTFTGDENIQLWSGTPTDDYCYFVIDGIFNYKRLDKAICNNLPYSSSPTTGKELISLRFASDLNRIYIAISKNKLTTPDVNGFKAWLKANPTTIVYQLATPTVEIVENCVDIDLDTFGEKTYFNILNSLPGTLDFKVPSNIASIVQNTAREVNNIWDVINNLLVPGILDVNKKVALATIKNNLK